LQGLGIKFLLFFKQRGFSHCFVSSDHALILGKIAFQLMSLNHRGMIPPCAARSKNKAIHFSIFCGRLVIAVLCLCQPVLVLGVQQTRLTWVNGIGYNLDHMILGQKRISELFGGKRVEFCHNPTSKASEDDLVGYLGDLTQAGTQKLGRVTEEVNLLVA
jgi:hypothetical protein